MAADEAKSQHALKSAQLYNSWRSTIFSSSYQRDTKKVQDFDTFVRKLKHRLRESEKAAAGELSAMNERLLHDDDAENTLSLHAEIQ